MTIRENESREVTVRFGKSDILVLKRRSQNESWQHLDVSEWNLPEFNFSFEWDPMKRRSARQIFKEYSLIKGPRESERTESVEKSPITIALEFNTVEDNVLTKRKTSSPSLADSSQSKCGKKD